MSSRDTRHNDEFPPLKVYHGTRSKFDAFSPVGEGTSSYMGIPVKTKRSGIFFAEHPEFAESFANPPGERKTGKVGHYHLNIKNPLMLDDSGQLDYGDRLKLKEAGMDPDHVDGHLTRYNHMWENFDGDFGVDFVDKLKKAGFDGVRFHEENPDDGEEYATWVAFHPNQVKSATDNSGAFDPNDDRFNYASGGAVNPFGRTRDNPGGEWLKRKQEDANPRRKFINGATTGTIGMHKEMFLPTDVLHQVPGLNDEKRIPGDRNYDHLMEKVKKEGFKKDQDGNKVVVAVNHLGQPYMLEGNTRVAVAKATGVPHVRAEVRYWNGGEDVDGPFHPEKVTAMAKSDVDGFASGGSVNHSERMKRAEAMGFDTSKVYYHGTHGGETPDLLVKYKGVKKEYYEAPDIKEFRVSEDGALGPGVYITEDPKVASGYAGTGGGRQSYGGHVYPVFVKKGAILKQIGGGNTDAPHEAIVGDPSHIRSVYANFDPAEAASSHISRATGGSVPRKLDRNGLYSKAADVARNLPQEKGTPEQMMAMLRKQGVKPAEIEHAGLGGDLLHPLEKLITKHQLAAHFDANKPDVRNTTWEDPDDFDEPDDIRNDVQYKDYSLAGGQNYRERLLHLPTKNKRIPLEDVLKRIDELAKNGRYTNHQAVELANKEFGIGRYQPVKTELTVNNFQTRKYFEVPDGPNYKSSHWNGVPNVLAHIRMQDRHSPIDHQKMAVLINKLGDKPYDDAIKDGSITREEAGYIQRGFGHNGKHRHYDLPDTLHVEEIQSDWGQDARKNGTYDHNKPFEVFHTSKAKDIISAHETLADAKNAAEELGPQYDYEDARKVDSGKVPSAPYIGNTQHWVDLALKHVLHEASKNPKYKKIVFTPGQAAVDRFGLENHFDRIDYHYPEDKFYPGYLVTHKDGNTVTHRIYEKDLKDYLGGELSEKLLSSDPVQSDKIDTIGHPLMKSLSGDNLSVGGEGMKSFYDQLIPKSAMRLAQQHDPSVKAETMDLPGHLRGGKEEPGYDGAFTIPITDTMRQSVLKGQPAFRDGGRV